MARGLNKVTFIGIVSRDPEMRFTPEGKPSTSFSMDISRNWTTLNGDYHEETECFDVMVWGGLAGTCKERLATGYRAFVGGRLQMHGWEDSFGQKHYRSEIVANQVLVLSETAPEESETGAFNAAPVSLNNIMIIGNLGRDPEMRLAPNSRPVTSFVLATSRRWSLPEGGKREATEWFNIVTWDNLAKICDRYLKRGSRVYIEGRIQTHERETSEGEKYRRLEVVAQEMIRLDRRENSDDT